MNNRGVPNGSDAAAVAAIREVIYSYCWYIDSWNDDALLELFTQDGEWRRPGHEPLRGRDQIAGYLRGRDRGVIGRHIASNVVVDFETRSQAKVASYYTVLKAGSGGAPQPTAMGEYHDVFRLDEGRWRIAQRETRRVFRAA